MVLPPNPTVAPLWSVRGKMILAHERAGNSLVFFFEDASADRDFFVLDAGLLERGDQVLNGPA